MANLELSKANKIKVLNSFPSSFVGKEGDLIISKISGKGKYLCAKVGGTWFAADKLNELNRLTTPKMSDLTVNSLKVGRLSILNKPTGGEIDLSAGDLTFNSSGSFIFEPIKNSTVGVIIDHNIDQTTTLSSYGLKIDTDMTGNLAAGQFGVYVAMDVDVNTDAATFSSSGTLMGLDIDMVGGTSGIQTIYGGQIHISGADSHIGMYMNVGAATGALSAKGLVTKVADGGYDIQCKSSANDGDYFTISVGAEGETTLKTQDLNTAVAHLTLDVDGDLILDPASAKIIINATDDLYFDGGTHTFIHEVSDDVLRIVVGGDAIMQLSEKGDDGNEVHFGSSCVGFTQLEPTYDATNTTVDFRHSNKQFLTFGSGNITNLKFFFPLVSGNFVCLIKQDGTGSRTITNYKAGEFDESAADGSSTVVFAGGSNPTLTTDANHVDIISIYWDADNEIAYGVATLDFQF